MWDQKTNSSGKTLNRQSAENQGQKKKTFNHFWLKYLLVFCFLIFGLCFAFVNSSLTWWETFPIHKYYNYFLSGSYHGNALPSDIYPRHKIHNYYFIIDNTEVCTNQTPFLVLMVPVTPGNVEARHAIRQTWGSESLVQGQLVVTLFMLGLSGENDSEKLNKENIVHHDLIQSNFIDTYLNLTIKTIAIMEWLATHCNKSTYAMKIDSDMFLNVDNLVTMLRKPETPELNYLTGMLMWNRPVIRSKDSKWYVPEELFPEPTYPTYTLGMGYVFSNDLPVKLVEVSKSIKPFNIEDAYIGMCMKKLGLTLTSPPDPSQFKAYATGYDRCEYSKIITYILGSPQELVNYWTAFKRPGPYC